MTDTEYKILQQAQGVTYEDALRDLRSIFYNKGGLYTDDSFAFIMAFKALETYIEHSKTYEWCHDCKEYDTENHCCHRWTNAIHRTVEEIKKSHEQN